MKSCNTTSIIYKSSSSLSMWDTIDIMCIMLLWGCLIMNHEKFKLLILHARHRPPPTLDSILVGSKTIHVSKSAKSIGTWFDTVISMDNQISNICKCSFYHLRDIDQQSPAIEKHKWKRISDPQRSKKNSSIQRSREIVNDSQRSSAIQKRFLQSNDPAIPSNFQRLPKILNDHIETRL